MILPLGDRLHHQPVLTLQVLQLLVGNMLPVLGGQVQVLRKPLQFLGVSHHFVFALDHFDLTRRTGLIVVFQLAHGQGLTVRNRNGQCVVHAGLCLILRIRGGGRLRFAFGACWCFACHCCVSARRGCRCPLGRNRFTRKQRLDGSFLFCI
ncbi:hypothetical protein D3C71_1736560 [compost metagenome]